MKFLTRLFGEKPPHWAQPISSRLYRSFQDDVMEVFEQRGMVVNFEWDLGGATDPETKNQFGFHNLVKVWLKSSPPDRKSVTKHFFDEILRNMAIANTKLIDQLEKLFVRVYDRQSMPPIPNLPLKPIGDNLVACLVVDGEHSLISVTDDQITESKLDIEELFRIAEDNVWKKVSTTVDRRELPFGLLTFISAEFFGASQILVLNRYTEEDTTYWVASPNRDLTLLLKPTTSNRESLQKFFEFAYALSNSSPYSLLPFVLEFQDGQFKDLVKIEGDQLKLVAW